MTWVALCDNMTEHRKMDRLEEITGGGYRYAAARTVWMDAACACARRLTDGEVTRTVAHRASRLPPKVVDRALADLTEAGFLDARDENVWAFHNWETYNPTREKIQAKRASGAERLRRFRDKKRGSNGVTAGVTNAVGNGHVTATPSPPLPQGKDTQRAHAGPHAGARGNPTASAPKPRSHTHGVEVGREGPNDALEPTGRPEVAPAPSEAAEGPTTARRDTIPPPPVPEPEAPAASATTPQTRPVAHALRAVGFVDPEAAARPATTPQARPGGDGLGRGGFCRPRGGARTEAFRAYMAAEWPDKVDTLTTSGQFAEYVGDNFRTVSKGVFQPTANATLLVAFGHAIVAEKLTRQEVREMAQVLLRQSKDVFSWDRHGAGAGGAVSLSMLLGKANGSGGYEARPFASLGAFTRERIADRAAKAQEAAASRPATVPALPHQEPAVVSGEILAQAKRMRDQLAVAAAEKRAEAEKRRAALGLDQVQPRVDRDSLAAAYADVPVLRRRAV